MKKTIKTYGQLACLISLFSIGVTGCTKEDTAAWKENRAEKVIITGSIEDAVTVESRTNPTDQFGSFTSGGFGTGEQIGFYSEYNNDRSEPGFQNECLTYTFKATETGEGE